jgi:hypothetical protein
LEYEDEKLNLVSYTSIEPDLLCMDGAGCDHFLFKHDNMIIDCSFHIEMFNIEII